MADLMFTFYYNNFSNFITKRISDTYPGMFPPGPMKVLNIKLKGTGGERSFPVMGDFTL